MAKQTKRIVSLLVSLFLLVSSMSVGFTVFAAEETGGETIVNGDTETGTAGEKYHMEVGSLNQKEINQTEVDPENNYSIPARLNESDPNYRPRHVYYRTTAPMKMGDTNNGNGWGILWDNNTNKNADFKGSDSDASARYSDCYTKIFYDFGDIYEINEVIWGNNNTLDYRASDITFYAGNDFADLFSEENEIGYLEGAEVAVSINTTGLKARYVAAKIGTMCQKVWNDGYLRPTEFNVLGKYFAKAQIGETTMHTSIDDAAAAVNGLTSIVATSPTIYTKINDTVKTDNKQYAGLYDGNLNGSELSNGYTHTQDDKYVDGKDVYTSFTYDLGAVKNVTKVLVAHGIGSGYHYQTSLFDIYVSEDEEIDETDLVAQVNDLGNPDAYKNPAHTVDLGAGEAGRYVELRIYAPARGFGNPLPSYFYWRLQEFNVYGNDDVHVHTAGEPVVKNEVAAECEKDGSYDNVVYCTVCEKEISRTTETIPATGHTAGEPVVENEVAAECEEDGSYDTVVYCTVCEKEISRTPDTIPATGHKMELNADKTAKVCANGCGEQIAVYVVSFLGKDDVLLHEVIVEEGGVLTAKDIADANAAVPGIFGYDKVDWNTPLTEGMLIERSMEIRYLYERQTAEYDTVLTDSNGNTVTKQVQFDQRFTVTDANATAFLVDGQVVGGAGEVKLYGCGALEIVASTTVEADGISVAILKTVVDEDNNVLSIFTNIYNPNNDVVAESGLIVLPGSIYADFSGAIELGTTKQLVDEKKALVIKSDANINQTLITYAGIPDGARRVVRAYATIGETTHYSKVIADKTFQ